MRTLPIALLALVLLAGCSERPPRPDPEHGAALNLQKGSNALAQRTLNQGEIERLGD